ncbi:MAG: YqaA family protein [Nitrospinota bacterium]
MFRPFRRLYDWVLHWAHTKYGVPALSLLSFAESSFFPVPPDPLLLALSVGRPKKAFRFAFYTSLFSVLGGILGYAIGMFFMDTLGFRILEFYGAMDSYETIKHFYQKYDAWAVGIAGFTPLPYKVFTIAAGAFDINLLIFVLASAFSRSARFFIEAGLVWKFGPGIKDFIDRYFNILSTAFVVCLVGGFILIALVF